MRRTVLMGIVTAMLLAIAAGAIAAALVMPAAPGIDASATGGAETVRRFYAAANEVIATGDPAALHAVVAPHFVDADPLPGVAPGRAGLEAYLLGLHAAEPGTRLEAEEVIVAGDRVVARVRVRNGSDAAGPDGAIVDRSPPWSAVESFRVAGGSIVERRADADELALAPPVAEAALAFVVPAPRVVTIKRFTFEPGARWDVAPVGPRLLVLEAGSLRLDRDDSGGQAVSVPVVLAEGGSVAVGAGDRYSATNVGAGVARLLVVTFTVPVASSQWPMPDDAFLSGVTVQTLAGGEAPAIGVGSATVSLARATLGPAAKLSLSSAEGPILVAIDAGEASMTAWGTAWVRRGEDGMSALTGEAALTAGDGLLLQPDGLVALHGAGTEAVELLIVTVRAAPAAPSQGKSGGADPDPLQ